MLAVSEILRHLCFLGATRTKDARELLYARQKVVVTTKAFGLQAIDLVHIDYKDLEGLRQQSREGALMGFTGKVLYIRVSDLPLSHLTKVKVLILTFMSATLAYF